MNNVINLNRFRKKKARAEKEKQAEENRVKYGRRKDDVAMETAEAKKQDAFLDGHKKDDDEG
jgi:hypothetical protein